MANTFACENDIAKHFNLYPTIEKGIQDQAFNIIFNFWKYYLVHVL